MHSWFCMTFDKKEFQKAETFLLRAQRPELAVRYYKVSSTYHQKFTVLSSGRAVNRISRIYISPAPHL